MARIRSVHPGLFTDEAFVSVSPMARLLWIGIWCECDDQGAFEWKPVGLKMRVLPADNADVSALLAELAEANMIRRYEVDGKAYGLVRNFQRYQRPKKPNSQYPIPPEFRTFLGSSVMSSPPAPPEAPSVGNQFPTSGENPPQMEDGGWRMEDGEEDGEERGGESSPPSVDEPPPEDEAPPELRAVWIWNEVVANTPVASCAKATDARLKVIGARLREDLGGSLEQWRAFVHRVVASPFLRGENDRGWRADIDFATRQSSFVKILEGKYDDRTGAPRRG